MGRWGDGLYDSDAALDFFSTISDKLEREIAYWASPEQIDESHHWCASVLTVIEIMLLLDVHDRGSTGYLEKEQAVRRWREVFMTVWNGDWNEVEARDRTFGSLGDPLYRQQHRAGVTSLFDRLASIAHFWTELSTNHNRPPLTPLLPEYPLPYFSAYRWRHPERPERENVSVMRFTRELIEHLVVNIIYFLSEEPRSQFFFNVEETCVAVDLLALLCEQYAMSPGVRAEVVQRWRTATLALEHEASEEASGENSDLEDPLILNIATAFNRLQAVAEKYPSYW